MIELQKDELVVRFPSVHPKAELRIGFQRTLRIPDDDREYPLPPGLGLFPLRHVDDFAERVPAQWIEHGGVMLPMYQSEALWLYFHADYPFAVKVSTGKIDAVTGKPIADGLHRRPQDYLVIPDQPWLDGYCVEKGVIRQFVAMPLGEGYSAEEQITGKAEHGGLQLVVHPMKRKAYERWQEKHQRHVFSLKMSTGAMCLEEGAAMGLAPGGRMRQEIYHDRNRLDDWDLAARSRCFVHLANSLVWRQITGRHPPTVPPTAKEYEKAGLPWFEYYDDRQTAAGGSDILAKLKSIATLGKEKGAAPLPENASVDPSYIVELRKGLKKGEVREGVF